MQLSPPQRALLLVILLAGLSGLLLWGGIDRPPAPELGDYPGTEEIATEPAVYQDSQVATGGTVVATDPVVIRTEYATKAGVETIQLQLAETAQPPTQGDRLQVFGVLTGPRTIEPTNIVVVPQSGQWYAWVISFLAGVWVLARIGSHWRIDRESGAFVPRPVPLERVGWWGE